MRAHGRNRGQHPLGDPYDVVFRSSRQKIDVYVAPELQGLGFGKKMLSGGERWVKKNTEITKLFAKVKETNQASLRMFAHCGFQTEFIFFKKEIN